MEQLIESLKSAGLNNREAITYLDLQEYGESQTGNICKRTKIPSSQIYTILNNLCNENILKNIIN